MFVDLFKKPMYVFLTFRTDIALAFDVENVIPFGFQ